MNDSKQQLTLHISHDLFKPSAYKTLDGLFDIETLHGPNDSFVFKSPIKYNISVTNTGDAFLITGNAKANALTSCSRCLEDVEVELSAQIDSYYLIEAPQDKEGQEINEFEILPDDHNIPLGQIITASLIVDAPAKPLCKEDCLGLCPQCGTNLNNNNCDCSQNEDSTSPFSVLKNLKV